MIKLSGALKYQNYTMLKCLHSDQNILKVTKIVFIVT